VCHPSFAEIAARPAIVMAGQQPPRGQPHLLGLIQRWPGCREREGWVLRLWCHRADLPLRSSTLQRRLHRVRNRLSSSMVKEEGSGVWPPLVCLSDRLRCSNTSVVDSSFRVLSRAMLCQVQL
jgi:hypothetical protein